jgi:hypothetical protein
VIEELHRGCLGPLGLSSHDKKRKNLMYAYSLKVSWFPEPIWTLGEKFIAFAGSLPPIIQSVAYSIVIVKNYQVGQK